MTLRTLPSAAIPYVANEVNRWEFCTHGEVFPEYSPLLCAIIELFTQRLQLPAIFWVKMLYLSITIMLSGKSANGRCRPNSRCGASRGNRNPIFCLEGRHNSRYTIPAYYFLFILHIYYIRNLEKNQILGVGVRDWVRTSDLQGHNLTC